MIERLISGGQTGVDRGALDAAMDLGIPIGGWCPRGRRSESGPIPARYALVQTPGSDYSQRTRFNVRDADSTLLIIHGDMTRGTALTMEIAEQLGRRYHVLDLGEGYGTQRRLAAQAFISVAGVLNVAGSRESKAPGIQKLTRYTMIELLR